MDAVSGIRLRNAELILRGAPGGPGSTSLSYSAASDKDGKFEITGVAPGAYRLSARRAGYLQTEYGARGSGRQGTMLTLVPGQRMGNLEVRLRRAGVISGRVTDEYGDPVERAQVRAFRYRWTGAERQMNIQASTSTDDQGNYRLFGLEPGRYYLQVTPAVSLTVGSAQTGKPARLAYTAVYYPGATDEAAASPIEIAAGSDITGVDFTLARVPSYRVTARVENQTGAGGRIMVMLRSRQGIDSASMTRFGTADPKTGLVDYQAVTPGSYVLIAALNEAGRTYRGMLALDVTDRDLTDLVVTLGPGWELTGEVRVEDSPGVDLGGLRVGIAGSFVVSVGSPGGSVTFGTNEQAGVGADGRFRLSNVFADASQITIAGLPDGFYVKSIQLGDRDVLESGLDLTGGPPSGTLRIVLRGKAAAVSGTVSGADGKPLGGATVALAPTSEKRRARPQFHKFATTDQNGRFRLRNVDPGQYRVYAWEDVETMAWLDPEFLKPFERKGVEVNLEPGANRSLQLVAIPAP